jgi:CDP-diacylglycerol--glycerol-3-phosphate 3-phosphatidyltransferase
MWGKLKTVTQIAMVLVLIIVDDRTLPVDILVWVTVLITVASGADYFFNFRSLLHARPSSHCRAET